jgi:hypothetical protein
MALKMAQFTVWELPDRKMGIWANAYKFKNITYREWCEREVKRIKESNGKASIRKDKKGQISVWKIPARGLL